MKTYSSNNNNSNNNKKIYKAQAHVNGMYRKLDDTGLVGLRQANTCVFVYRNTRQMEFSTPMYS